MSSSVEQSLVVQKYPVSDKKTKEVICNLVGYLVAAVSRSEAEWRDWSRPFLSSMYISQFGDDEGQVYFASLDERLCPMIGKEKSLWIVSNDTKQEAEEEDQDYLIVKHAEQHLIEEFSALDSDLIDQEIPLFVQSFSQLLLTQQHYDGRMRTIAQKLCRMLHASVKEFSEQEKAQFKTGTNAADFAGDFKHLADAIPRQSLLVQYRMWRVGLVAAGGGAMVGLAGLVAAPTIMSTLLPLMTTAVTYTQISVTMETFLVYTGSVIAYPWIPSLFTAYGASVAGRCMLERTKEMQEFELLPLHIPTAHDSSIHGSKFALNSFNASLQGGPVYILVPGHLYKDVDVRALWGANGSILLLEDDKSQTEHSNPDEKAVINPKTAPCTAGVSPATPSDHKSIIQDVIEHEVYALQQIVVHKLEAEIELQTQNFPEFVRNEVHLLTQAAEKQVMSCEFDKEEEEEWEKLKVRYQGWWRDLVSLGEEYVLQWETDLLQLLNDSLMDIIFDQIKAKIFSKVKDALLNFAASAIYPLKKAMALPNMVLAKIKEMDGAWLRAMDKARQAGQLMARTLLAQKQQSQAHSLLYRRPVTLIGYGMGARLIFHCLEYLHDHGGEDGKGIVEHAILLGAPVPTIRSNWLKARAVVANRLVNCYARFDWILALLYRIKSYDVGVAGLYPVFINEENHRQHEQTLGKLDDNALVRDSKTLFDEDNERVELKGEQENVIVKEVEESEIRVPLPDFAAAEMEHLQEVENIDITHIVSVHSDYPKLLYTILDLVKL